MGDTYWLSVPSSMGWFSVSTWVAPDMALPSSIACESHAVCSGEDSWAAPSMREPSSIAWSDPVVEQDVRRRREPAARRAKRIFFFMFSNDE